MLIVGLYHRACKCLHTTHQAAMHVEVTAYCQGFDTGTETLTADCNVRQRHYTQIGLSYSLADGTQTWLDTHHRADP